MNPKRREEFLSRPIFFFGGGGGGLLGVGGGGGGYRQTWVECRAWPHSTAWTLS